jgi:hypothetical protein
VNEIIERHLEKVKSLGYSEEQSRDLIHKLSHIMSAFIDAAWGVHPAQQAQNKAVQRDSVCDRIGTNSKHIIEGASEVKPSEA